MPLNRTLTSSASRAANVTARRPQPHLRRLQSTASGSQKADSSHLLAGLGGGAVVLAGVFGYYHYSGTAQVVSTARTTIDSATAAKEKLLAASPSPKEAADLLRSASKAYLSALPGAGPAIDQAFDTLEGFAEKHGEEAREILQKSYGDIQAALKDGKDGGEKILKAVQEAVEKAKSLGGEQVGKAMDKLYEKNPELKKAVGAGAEDFKKLAEKHGPEARRIVEDTYSQASDIVAKGGMNAKTYDAVKKLFDQKTKEVSALAKKSGADAWQASAKNAGPLLDKMPDVKGMVEENLKGLEGLAGEENVKVVKDFYADLEKISKSGKSPEEMTKEAKKLVESRVGSFEDLKKKAKQARDGAKDAAGSQGAELAASIPGLSKILDDGSLKQLKELAEKHGEEAEKILQSTYEDIKKVLQSKVEEAKKVGENAKGDVKKTTK